MACWPSKVRGTLEKVVVCGSRESGSDTKRILDFNPGVQNKSPTWGISRENEQIYLGDRNKSDQQATNLTG